MTRKQKSCCQPEKSLIYSLEATVRTGHSRSCCKFVEFPLRKVLSLSAHFYARNERCFLCVTIAQLYFGLLVCIDTVYQYNVPKIENQVIPTNMNRENDPLLKLKPGHFRMLCYNIILKNSISN